MPQRIPSAKPIDVDWRRTDKTTTVAAPVAEADIAAAFLVEVMGEDVAAAFFARFGVVMADACRKAETLAHVLRAHDEPETEVHVSQVCRAGSPEGAQPIEDRSHVRDLAARIERGEEIAPIVLKLRPKACCSSQPYDMISGWDELSAFVDVLGRTAVPVQIVPPVPPKTLTLFDISDA
jgi:hypothetical protein